MAAKTEANKQMTNRHARTRNRRPSKTVFIRFGLALACGAIGCASVVHSVAYKVRNADPALAHGLAPWDARSTGLLALQLAGISSDPTDRTKADALARTALRRDPTVITAITAIGLNAQARRDTDNAKKLFSYSNTISRRDFPTRLWLIEDAVADNDIARALVNYDIALRTSPKAPETLYPVLAEAGSDPEIAPYVAATLAQQSLWTEGFIGYLAANGNPVSTVNIFRLLNAKRMPVPPQATSIIINRLIADQKIDEAWTYYSSIQKVRSRNQSRDEEFSANLESPTLFDWNIVTDISGISTSIESSEGKGSFIFSAAPMTSGTILRQRQILSSGEYVLTYRTSRINQPSRIRPYWTLNCVGGPEIGRAELQKTSAGAEPFTARFIISEKCPMQSLDFVVRASDDLSGVSGEIIFASLRPR